MIQKIISQPFIVTRERNFVLASAPKMKFAANLEYGINKFTAGARFTYFGKVNLLGYGEDGLGIDPQVPSDVDPNILVKDEYVYNGKLVSDLYFSYKISKALSLFL